MKLEPLTGKARLTVTESTCRLNLYEGSVRSSKTVSSLLAWLLYVRNGPAGNLLMVGKTERTLKRNVIDPLTEWLGRSRCRHVIGEGELHLLGRRIYLAGANDEKAQEKIRGLTLAGAYVDEASTTPESFWAMLLTRLSVEGARLFGTTNPDGPNHWLLKKYLQRASVWVDHDGQVHRHDGPAPDGEERLDLARFSFRLADNPTLDPAYVEALSREFTGLWRKRFIDGLWVLAEGAIFDTFDDERHVVDVLPQISRWWLAVDYGTTNPFVALLIGLGVDDRLYVAREWRWDSSVQLRQKTDAQYSADLAAWLDLLDPPGRDGELPGAGMPEVVAVDPSAASFIAQLWSDGWRGVRGADNAVDDGLRAVANLLAADRLLIHESCTGLLAELPGYVWDAKAAKRGEDAPLKVDDHGPDALRYGVQACRRVWSRWVLAVDEDLDEAA